MNQKEYELIADAIARTEMINGLDRNKERRGAKHATLRLFVADLCGTLKHNYPKTFDETKFIERCRV
jgi:hypothetical protein